MKSEIPKSYVIGQCIVDMAKDKKCSISEAEYLFNERMDKKKRLKTIKRKRRELINAKRKG